jgi:hypothetical protein
MNKGRSPAEKNRKSLLAIIRYAHFALPPNTERASTDPTVQCSRPALFTLRR